MKPFFSKVAFLTVLCMSGVVSLRAQTNSWLGGNGNWQTQSQWNLNQSPSSNQNIVVTNAGTFTVTIDDNTASHFPGTLTIQSLLASDSAGTSTILMTNRPTSTTPITLTISGNATISSGSALNAVDTSSGRLGVTVQASSFTIDGSALVQGNGGFQGGGVNVGVQSGAHGVWQIAGGSNTVNYPRVQIGVNTGATGEVWMSSGLLQTPGNTLLGDFG